MCVSSLLSRDFKVQFVSSTLSEREDEEVCDEASFLPCFATTSPEQDILQSWHSSIG